MRIIALLLLSFLALPAKAETSALRQALLPSYASITITHVIDGRTLAAEGGRILRLSEVYVPQHAKDTEKQAILWLRENIMGQRVRLYITRDENRGRRNRFDYEMVHMEGNNGLWVQASLVNRGLAITLPSAFTHEMSAPLLNYEAEARADKRGIWAETVAVLNPESVKEKTGSFQIVEGKTYSVSSKNNIIYINFTRDWRSDFTIRIRKEDRIAFSRAGMNPLRLTGKKLRVRGFVEEYNGPMITATHPSQIEVLD